MLEVFATERCLGYRLAEYFGDHNALNIAAIVRYVTAGLRGCLSRQRCRRLWIKTSRNCAVNLSTGMSSTQACFRRPSA